MRERKDPPTQHESEPTAVQAASYKSAYQLLSSLPASVALESGRYRDDICAVQPGRRLLPSLVKVNTRGMTVAELSKQVTPACTTILPPRSAESFVMSTQAVVQ